MTTTPEMAFAPNVPSVSSTETANAKIKNHREAAFHPVHRGRIRFAQTEEVPVVAADDGQELLFLTSVRLAHEDNDFLPVKSFGGWFRFVELFTGLGELDPSFQSHHASGGMLEARSFAQTTS